jgi:MoaA/NifB/PqqE/SkfB family radical SAM enzyme
MFDFANILFSGPCNARCTFCIGQQIDPALNQDNLHLYPPRNLGAFIAQVQHHGVRQVVFTGTNTDPQRYQHEERLLAHLRQRLTAGTQFSLHTNGLLVKSRLEVFNQYDRVTVSFPSFEPATYRRLMGRASPPDLAGILKEAAIPVKISCVVTPINAVEMPAYLSRCADLGIRRVVLRKLYGEARPWKALLDLNSLALAPAADYSNNPVCRYRGMEVTLWDFCQASSKSLNLFSSGLISPEYLLERAQG